MSWEFEPIGGPFTLTEGPAWDGEGRLHGSTDLPLSEALAASLRGSGSLRGHPDSIEGPRAWMEKREPKWSS